MKKNKILILASVTVKTFGGMERYIYDQAVYFKEKNEVSVLIPKSDLFCMLKKVNLKVSNIKKNFRSIFLILFTQPNIVLIHHEVNFFIFLSIYLTRAKVFFFCHNPTTNFNLPSRKIFLGIRGIGLWKVLQKTKFSLIFRRSINIICVSNFLKECYSKEYPLFSSKIVVLTTWVDTKKFKPNLDEKKLKRRALNIPEKALVYICAARICKTKRIDRLIGAFLLAQKHINIPCYCVIIGDANYGINFKKAYKNVIFLNRKDDIENWLNIGDFFVLSSDHEGFSFSVLEAMATGLYPIVTDVADWKNLIFLWKEGILSKKDVFSFSKALIHGSKIFQLQEFLISQDKMIEIVKNNYEKNLILGLQNELFFK